MRITRTHVAALAVAVAVALAGSSAAMAAGGSGGGGGTSTGGGGGGGSAALPCGDLTVSINENTLGIIVPSWWQANTFYGGQALGTTTKSCDTIPGLVVTFEDVTSPADSCTVTIGQFWGTQYTKYGIKPISRYASTFYYFTGADCIGHPRTIRATMSNTVTGAVLSTATTIWTP
ncbi:MAG: hypothetical protein RLZZ623_97 [Actinomycetota bacterium]|jgi:hypothetical protein